MSNSLPPLPELSYLGEGGESNYGYDAEDMHAYARAATEASRAAVPAGWVLSGKYGDVLTPFVALMEAELHANSQKGDRPGWLTMSPETGLLEIYWHTAKLSAAVKNNDGPAIIEHSADVANMAMMLLDVCGGLAAAPQPVAQPGERWHVGDSAFESWFANYCPAGKGDKQRARDAYAAGMGDRAPVTQAKPEQAAQPLTPAQIEALEREASELVAPPEMTESMCLEWLVRKVEAAHGIAAPQPKD